MVDVRGELDRNLLGSLSLLAGVDAEHLSAIACRMYSRPAAAGEVLAREGESGRTFGIVMNGRVEITRMSPAGPRHLADATAGSLLGELAVLRGQPRTATLTAITPSLLAVGEADALEVLLDVPVVRERIRRLASARLARDLRPLTVRLKDGTPILVRPLLPEDRDGYSTELRGLSQDSLRRRFFSPGSPSQAMVDYLLDLDYVDHFAWVVLDGVNHRRGLATARFVRLPRGDQAETAFTTVDRAQGRGIGTFLLGALGVAAHEAGIVELIGHVLEDNAAMRAVFAKAHPISRFDEPGVLAIDVEAETAAALLPDDTRKQLAAAVHDIVTAASLALARHEPPASES